MCAINKQLLPIKIKETAEIATYVCVKTLQITFI